MTPLFDPKDVKVAAIILQVVAAGGTFNFPAPATANANRIRYLLAWNIGNNSIAAIPPVTIEDQNGNLLGQDSAARTPTGYCVLLIPLLVASGGAQNALRIRNNGGAADTFSVWIQFADVQQLIIPAHRFAMSL